MSRARNIRVSVGVGIRDGVGVRVGDSFIDRVCLASASTLGEPQAISQGGCGHLH